jgi:hypothetical protein
MGNDTGCLEVSRLVERIVWIEDLAGSFSDYSTPVGGWAVLLRRLD